MKYKIIVSIYGSAEEYYKFRERDFRLDLKTLVVLDDIIEANSKREAAEKALNVKTELDYRLGNGTTWYYPIEVS